MFLYLSVQFSNSYSTVTLTTVLEWGKTDWFYWDREAEGLLHYKRDLRWKVERWKGQTDKLQQQKSRFQQRECQMA